MTAEKSKKTAKGSENLTPRKEKALQALLVCRTQAEAAQMAGISESTLRTYMQDNEFLDRYREAFGGLVEEAARQAQKAVTPALSTLRDIMEDKDEQATARIQAARSTLEYALKLTEQADILTQLRELEQWRKEQDGQR